jgi:hypothetical protein
MALLKHHLLKENVINFIADIPAYAFIAYANFIQIVPTDYPAWEMFMLKHGWLMLLTIRLMVAIYDFVLRIQGNFWKVELDGKTKKKSLWAIITDALTLWIK